MSIKVCFFGALSEQFKKNEMWIESPNPMSILELYHIVFSDFPEMAKAWQNVLMFAKNCEHVDNDTQVQDGDEVAFMPPMAGG